MTIGRQHVGKMQRNEFLTPLDVEPINNSNRWIVIRRLRYVTEDGREITVPEGFVTDFASVPALARVGSIAAAISFVLFLFFWPMLFPLLFSLLVCFLAEWLENSGTDEIAVVHDYLYQTKIVPRGAADLILYEGMAAKGATVNPTWKRVAFFLNVRLFGFVAWRNDSRKKRKC